MLRELRDVIRNFITSLRSYGGKIHLKVNFAFISLNLMNYALDKSIKLNYERGKMGKVNQTNSYTEFYYHFFRSILVVALPLLIISALVLSSLYSSATGSGSGTDNLTISISSACTLSSVVDIEHSTNTNVGTYTSDIGKTTIKTLCNDGNGYSVYVVGYSNNEEGNNKLINSEYPQYSIDTGLATSGLISAWAMKLNNIPDDPSPTPPTIESDYNNVYGIVPPYWTKVAGRQSGTTDMAEGSSFTTTYAIYASSSQYAGTYQGQVKYLLTHPYSTDEHIYYMQEVDTWKNTLALEQSVQAIDKRDGKKYWVAKLKDGNIWMTQNLDLDLDPAKPLTSNDTDLTDHSLTGAYADNYSYDPNTGITTWTPERGTIDFQNTTVTGWVNDDNNPYSANKTDSTETGHISLGNYYNWSAAIASNNSSSLTQDTISNISDNPKNSICPKGWRLPTISSQSAGDTSSTNEFAKLNYLYNNDKISGDNSNPADTSLINSPLWFMKSGYVASYPGLGGLQTEANYWSSTVYDSSKAYRLLFRSDKVDTAYVINRYFGWSVRCVAR